MNQLDLLFSFIYPNHCAICDKINEDCLCKKCEIKLNSNKKLITDYYTNEFFLSHTYLFSYEGIIREKLIEYKFQNKPYLARMFAKLINSEESTMKIVENYDYIIPVPIHKKRKSKRGYNQSELILKYFVPKKNKINSNVLRKVVNNSPQSSLNKAERKENVKGVYMFNNQMKINLKNKKILLFDDIFTTGSTARECSKILKDGGASKIDVFTIAKD